MTPAGTANLTPARAMQDWATGFDSCIERYLNTRRDVPPQLMESVAHSLRAPGKRLRPYLVDCCYRLAGGGPAGQVTDLCLAAECLHVFTLIHDDLPAMDDADTRRGRPSNHTVFGEALAILAGDALLAAGLELAAGAGGEPPTALKIVREFVDAIGWSGVIGGQVRDILSEQQPADESLTRVIHRQKTARLIEACCRVGALAAEADPAVLEDLGNYGLHLGLAFQIADDLLDATAGSAAVGKHTGRDQAAGKQSYPAAIGVTESRRRGEHEMTLAVQSLAAYGSKADVLRQVARFVIERTW